MLTPKTTSTRNWKASMAQDVTKGRPTEIDYMNGHVVAQGRVKGVPTPVSAAIVEAMHEVERGARKPAPENIGLVLKRAGV
jgi:2-dehydropantoate 2-reductase